MSLDLSAEAPEEPPRFDELYRVARNDDEMKEKGKKEPPLSILDESGSQASKVHEAHQRSQTSDSLENRIWTESYFQLIAASYQVR
jgi:hypothetical protein